MHQIIHLIHKNKYQFIPRKIVKNKQMFCEELINLSQKQEKSKKVLTWKN